MLRAQSRYARSGREISLNSRSPMFCFADAMEARAGAHHLGRKLEKFGQSLFPLFNLAAAVDNEGHFLAVLHRLGGNSFGGGFDVPNLRVTCGFELGH
jgi:hypothetical protein